MYTETAPGRVAKCNVAPGRAQGCEPAALPVFTAPESGREHLCGPEEVRQRQIRTNMCCEAKSTVAPREKGSFGRPWWGNRI